MALSRRATPADRAMGLSFRVRQVEVNAEREDADQAERTADALAPDFDRVVRRVVVAGEMRGCSLHRRADGAGKNALAVAEFLQVFARGARGLLAILR